MFSKLLTGIVYLLLAMILIPFIEWFAIGFFMPEERGWEWLDFSANLVLFTDVFVFIFGVLAIGYWMGKNE